MQIQIKRKSPTHVIAKVTTRGYVYASSYANDEGDEQLTEAQVREDWKTNRRAFQPYDESSGIYLR